MVRPRTIPVLPARMAQGEGLTGTQFDQTCHSLQAVLRQLEELLPPGLEGLQAVRRMQAEVEGRFRPWRDEAPRAKSA